MANRNTLSTSKLDKFKEWLINNGWTLQKTKGVYEVVRATKQGYKYPLIVYDRNKSPLGHFTVLDRDMKIIRDFLGEKK